ncbi:MAG: Holliday junction branch migration protein RuvA [Gammaproteobacteria bacterium]|jgi:Holliday junction DNA helicase RuvA|nr:Holliday junction branch migration protein RuvA [Gammaproteobacteria bacterium]
MIGRLKGRLIQKQPPWLLIDVQGVAYEVEAPMTTIYKLPAIDEELTLFTHLLVRDDAHLLFGFAEEHERLLFRTLIKVNGVGAKMALAILSGMEADEFANCIRDGDSARLTRLPGVGKKTAERLIVEMRDKLKDWQSSPSSKTDTAKGPVEIFSDPADEAVSALVSLGYKPQEASKYVLAVASEDMSSEEIIREALKASVK